MDKHDPRLLRLLDDAYLAWQAENGDRVRYYSSGDSELLVDLRERLNAAWEKAATASGEEPSA